jgi:hypothetical protein
MNQRDSDAPAVVGRVDLPVGQLLAGAESLAQRAGQEREGELQELLDYLPVPLRPGETFKVRFRHGGRLQPLPYPLDEVDE